MFNESQPNNFLKANFWRKVGHLLIHPCNVKMKKIITVVYHFPHTTNKAKHCFLSLKTTKAKSNMRLQQILP